MQKQLPLGPFLEKRRGVYLFDDFLSYTDGQLWTLFKSAVGGEAVAINSGGVAGSGVNGQLKLTTGGTANNYAGLALTNAPFEIRDNDPIVFEVRLNYAETHTNQAVLGFGLSDVADHTQMQNGTAGPVGTFYGAMIYKIQGETIWRVCTSQGTTQLLDQSTASTVSTSDQILRIELRPVGGLGGLLEVNFWIMDLEAINANSQVIPPKPIKHRIAYTAPVNNMKAFALANAGGAYSEVVSLDYIAVEQLRGVP